MAKRDPDSPARDLRRPVLGADKTDRLTEQLVKLESVSDVRQLRPLLTEGC